jgi:ferredoxin
VGRPGFRERIMKTVIYYFTGTGNSLKIARDIANEIPDSEVRHIAAAMADGKGALRAAGKIGIVFPVYVEGLPLIVERFVRCLDIQPGTYIFAVSNYGESAGGSLVQLEQIFQEKGRGLDAAFGLKMPDNTQILFPPSPAAEQKRDLKRAAEAVEAIAQTVSEGAEAGANLLQAARCTPKSSWQRPAFDPVKMAEKFSADEKCNGCGICESICPVSNVEMNGGKPRWLNRCELCLACMQWCPQEAIQFGTQSAAWGRYHHPDVRVEELLRTTLK